MHDTTHSGLTPPWSVLPIHGMRDATRGKDNAVSVAAFTRE
jgi:hypothetical protein